jgi:hypothetical protein
MLLPARLILVIDIRELLSVVVAHDKADGLFDLKPSDLSII